MPLMTISLNNKLDPFFVTLVNVLARISHLLFFLIIGNKYGATAITDSVFYLQAPILVLMAVVTGAVDAVVMPVFHRADGKDTAKYLLHYSIKRIVVFTLPLSGLVLVIFSSIRGGFDWILICILIPLPLFGGLAALKSAILNASNRFKAALLGPLFGGLVSVPFVLLASPDIHTFAFGFLLFEIGKFLGVSLFTDLSAGGRPLQTSIGDNIAQWGTGNAKWQMLGSFILALVLLIDIWFASALDAGSVTYVEYANKLWNIVPLLFVGHIAMAYASFSRSASHGIQKTGTCSIHSIAVRYGIIAFFVSMLLILSAKSFVGFLYNFGEMGGDAQVKLTTLLQCYLVGAGPYVCGLVYVRAFSAVGRVSVLTFVACIGLITNILFDALLVHFFGLNGIGIATSIVCFVNMLVLASWYERMRMSGDTYAV